MNSLDAGRTPGFAPGGSLSPSLTTAGADGHFTCHHQANLAYCGFGRRVRNQRTAGFYHDRSLDMTSVPGVHRLRFSVGDVAP